MEFSSNHRSTMNGREGGFNKLSSHYLFTQCWISTTIRWSCNNKWAWWKSFQGSRLWWGGSSRHQVHHRRWAVSEAVARERACKCRTWPLNKKTLEQMIQERNLVQPSSFNEAEPGVLFVVVMCLWMQWLMQTQREITLVSTTPFTFAWKLPTHATRATGPTSYNPA